MSHFRHFRYILYAMHDLRSLYKILWLINNNIVGMYDIVCSE